MVVKVRIKLNSTDIETLNTICESIKELAKKSGINISGPVPLPTKKLKITTRKSPCGNGTATFDRFEMRIHKRLIDLPSNEKVLHNIMKMYIPKNVIHWMRNDGDEVVEVIGFYPDVKNYAESDQILLPDPEKYGFR